MREMCLTAAFAALAFFSCTKEMEVPTPQKEQQPEAEKVWTVTVEAARGADDLTKAVLTGDGWIEEEADAATKGLELEGNYLKSTWDFKEKVFVYKGTALVGELESQRFGENTTLLSGSLSGSFTVGESLNLYLVGPENARNYIGQKGTLEDISAYFDYAAATVTIKKVDGGDIFLSTATFESLQSINEISFGSANVTHLTISGAGIVGKRGSEAFVSVTPQTPVNKLYVAISNNKTGVKIPYEFTVETDNGKVFSLRKKAALQNGKYYSTRLSLSLDKLYEAISTPLTFEALDDGYITIQNPNSLIIQWTRNEKNTSLDSFESSNNPITIPVSLGDKVEFHCENDVYGDPSDLTVNEPASTIFTCNVPHYVYGNVASLRGGWSFNINGAAFLTAQRFAYSWLFSRNEKMYNHPYKDIVLPEKTLYAFAYAYMFYYCTNLTRAPQMSADNLINGVKGEALPGRQMTQMFYECSNLVKAPAILPAMKLPIQCYAGMFYGCSSLETAPILPATEDVYAKSYSSTEAYRHMFYYCSNLKQVTCYLEKPNSLMTSHWLEGVPSSGTFIKAPNAKWPASSSGIPVGWGGGQDPLTIEAIEDGTITILNPRGLTLRYSKDADMSLSNATSDIRTQIDIPVSAGDKLRLWGDNAAYGHEVGPVSCTNIIGSGLHYVYGDLCSLISSGEYTQVETLSPYAFASLFSGNDKLKSHPTEKLVIRPATVGDGCFRNMFQGCTALERAPELPATTLASYCYESMFSGCTSLTLAPDLPATTLAEGSYGGMFFGCTALQNPPAISAQTLAMGSCMNMFSDCTSLKESPELKAQTLSQYCYAFMFSRCTSLKKITCTASNISADNALMDWVDGVPSGAGGLFIKKSGVDWPTGISGIPSGWTVQQSQ